VDEASQIRFEEGPLGAASNWVNAILRDGSLKAAWPLTDEDMREDLAASWVAVNRRHPLLLDEDPEAIAEDLATLEPTRPLLWDGFELSQVAFLRDQMAAVDLDTWCWATDPRPLGVDLEGALFIDAGPLDEVGRPLEPLRPGEHPALAFVMQYVDSSWLVSAVSVPEAPAPGT
jgi:hypothetical protein